MSDIAHCPCCGAVAKVSRDENGMPSAFKVIQDEALVLKVQQLKKALEKMMQERSPKTSSINS